MALMKEIRNNTLLGKVLGHGVQVTGDVLGCKRIPAAKGQAFAGYDPRGLKGNGVTYAMSTMGGDHTAGNCFGSRGEVNPLGKEKSGRAVQIPAVQDVRAGQPGLLHLRPPAAAQGSHS